MKKDILIVILLSIASIFIACSNIFDSDFKASPNPDIPEWLEKDWYNISYSNTAKMDTTIMDLPSNDIYGCTSKNDTYLCYIDKELCTGTYRHIIAWQLVSPSNIMFFNYIKTKDDMHTEEQLLDTNIYSYKNYYNSLDTAYEEMYKLITKHEKIPSSIQGTWYHPLIWMDDYSADTYTINPLSILKNGSPMIEITKDSKIEQTGIFINIVNDSRDSIQSFKTFNGILYIYSYNKLYGLSYTELVKEDPALDNTHVCSFPELLLGTWYSKSDTTKIDTLFIDEYIPSFNSICSTTDTSFYINVTTLVSNPNPIGTNCDPDYDPGYTVSEILTHAISYELTGNTLLYSDHDLTTDKSTYDIYYRSLN